ncbi:hypothetical protein N431DRAFT_432235 [Stipitochalara longipes BDJ]|nr:hypothetical protein N431DRAFT_432235 [Stipitochalara longipes BDJ]
MSTLTNPPETFSLFSALPSELQLQVWSHAISSFPPRILELHKVEIPLPNVPGWWTSRFASHTPIPSLLHTCRASRSLALTRWTLSSQDPLLPTIFFDFSSDMIFLDEPLRTSILEVEALPQADRERLHHVVIYHAEWQDALAGRDIAWLIYDIFPCLKEVIIVRRDNAHLPRGVEREKTLVRLVGYKPAELCHPNGCGMTTKFKEAYGELGLKAPAITYCDFCRYSLGDDGV